MRKSNKGLYIELLRLTNTTPVLTIAALNKFGFGLIYMNVAIARQSLHARTRFVGIFTEVCVNLAY